VISRRLYAPALIDSIPKIGYEGYLEVYGIENVSQSQQSGMPAFGEVEDMVSYVDDIYSYLKARADGAIGRGPAGTPAKVVVRQRL
jgi:hypothetical protein